MGMRDIMGKLATHEDHLDSMFCVVCKMSVQHVYPMATSHDVLRVRVKQMGVRPTPGEGARERLCIYMPCWQPTATKCGNGGGGDGGGGDGGGGSGGVWWRW